MSLVSDRLYPVDELAQYFGVAPREVRNAVVLNMFHEDKDGARYGLCELRSLGWVVQARFLCLVWLVA